MRENTCHFFQKKNNYKPKQIDRFNTYNRCQTAEKMPSQKKNTPNTPNRQGQNDHSDFVPNRETQSEAKCKLQHYKHKSVSHRFNDFREYL
jgi:hypothetical protein